MRKVVIITRKEAYKSGKASDEITSRIETSDSTAGQCKIHNYVCELIKSDFESNKQTHEYRYPELLSNIDKAPNTKSIVAKRSAKREEFKEYKKQNSTAEDYPIWAFNTYIALELNSTLGNYNNPKDCKVKPYLQFTYKNKDEDIKVCFVFLDEILGLFVKSPNEYRNFLNNEDKAERLEFIKAICEDCDVKKGEGNILYIHDKEWYDSNNEKLALYEGNWDPEYEREEYAPKLKEYFKTIQVFTHNSPSFERIKELEFIFPEKEMEVKIEDRKYF